MGKKFGKVHRFALDTNTPAEAFAALLSQHAGLAEHWMSAKDRGIVYAIFVGDRNVTEDELSHSVGDADIRIAPIIMGSKQAGIFQIILGAVLVVIGGLITGWSFGTATPFGTAVAGMGISMMVGGVVQLLTPMPKTVGSKDKPENTASYTFNGPLNT